MAVGGLIIAAAIVGGLVIARNLDVLMLHEETPVLAPTLTRAELRTPLDAVKHYQCNRCHQIDSLEPPSAPLNENCVTCHQAILDGRLSLSYDAKDIATWQSHLVHLVRTPSLDDVGQRVTRPWFISYLTAPYAVRPLGGATMPKLAVGPREAALLADFFHVQEVAEDAPPSVGDVARGEALYTSQGCAGCHSRGAPFAADHRYGAPAFREASSAQRRAPDLSFVQERMSQRQLRAWLSDPAKVLRDTEMPKPALSSSQVDDLVAFLWRPVAVAAPLPTRAPRLLEKAVRYRDVADKLTRHLCFHCHSDSARGGDLGPGNSGGLGYPGVSLDLATLDGVRRGIKRDGGFLGQPDRMPNGVPRLVASLMARKAEMRGTYDPALLGMPLGFPPLPDDEIDLIYTWLERGAPE